MVRNDNTNSKTASPAMIAAKMNKRSAVAHIYIICALNLVIIGIINLSFSLTNYF